MGCQFRKADKAEENKREAEQNKMAKKAGGMGIDGRFYLKEQHAPPQNKECKMSADGLLVAPITGDRKEEPNTMP